MEHFGKTMSELLALCEKEGIKGKKSHSNAELTRMLNEAPVNTVVPVATPVTVPVKKSRAKKVVATPLVVTPVAVVTPNKLRMIDLFAGTGAFTHAFQGTNKVQCVFANDMVESSKKIYDENYDHKLTLKDLNEVKVEDIPPHDILTGGFPCQPFSLAGRQEGFQDPRSNVFWKILQIIDYHNPRCVVLENVKNLVTHDEGNTFKTIKESLEGRGYHIRFKVLNTAQITGIPQHRERIYLVCLKSKDAFDKFSLDFPNIAKGPVSSCFSEAVADKYYYTDASSTWDLVSQNVLKKNTIYQYRRVYVRENKSNECPTLTANMGGGGHNVPLIKDDKGIRKLTPRECFNFQGFPQTYKLPALADSNLYKLAGNAVSVPVVKLIAERLMALI